MKIFNLQVPFSDFEILSYLGTSSPLCGSTIPYDNIVERGLFGKFEGELCGKDVFRTLPEVGLPIFPFVNETVDDEFVGHQIFIRARCVVHGMVFDSTLS